MKCSCDGKTGELKIYFNDIKKYKPITREEEIRLIERIKSGDKESLDKLVNSNLRFVVNVAKAYRKYGMPFSDLVSEGNIGLIKAAQKFDESKGVRFISYAVWWIRAYIRNYIDSYQGHMEIPLRDELRLDNDDDHEYLEKDDAAQGYYNMEESCVRDKMDTVTELMSCLQEREMSIILMYFGFLDDHKEKTLDEISSKMGITKERIRQIKDKALIKIRTKALLSENFNEYCKFA